MKKVLLDSNIYNRLQRDPPTIETLRTACDAGDVQVIVTPKIVAELSDGPFGGVPDWFHTELIAESVMVVDHSFIGWCYLGSGEVYERHRGNSNKVPDAIIADTADSSADILVSEDRRCRERLRQISNRCKVFTYREFSAWLAAQRRDARVPT